VVASDKLFYWLFQQHAERIQPLVAELLPQMDWYVFSAPVLKEREYRLDGLFLPPPDQPDLPVLILEAQMASDPPLAGGGDLPVAGSEFRRPHAGTGVCGAAGGVD
jgi:predicted transposase YdaD